MSTLAGIKKKRILVIEDNEDIAKALALRLKLKGYEVSRVANGLDALALLLRGEEPGGLILDLMLPGRSGLELLNSIKAKWRDTRIFIFSAYDNFEHVIPPGYIDGFFLKTQGIDSLIEALEQSLDVHPDESHE